MTNEEITEIAFGLTDAEKSAIRSLKRLSKKWPDTLWLFSASGSLAVMRCDDNGDHAHVSGGSLDPAYLLETIDIPNDGGDW